MTLELALKNPRLFYPEKDYHEGPQDVYSTMLLLRKTGEDKYELVKSTPKLNCHWYTMQLGEETEAGDYYLYLEVNNHNYQDDYQLCIYGPSAVQVDHNKSNIDDKLSILQQAFESKAL